MTWRVAITKVAKGDIEAAVRHAVTSAGSFDELIKKTPGFSSSRISANRHHQEVAL